MPALYSHTTRSTGTVLTATIYNGDHQNHIDNGIPLQHDDYSVNATQMQTITDPGEVGTESLATTQAGEFERLRFAIKEMKNTAQWYTSVIGLGLGYSKVRGLVGAVNAGTPLTKYDISADAAVCRDTTGGTLVKVTTGTLTCDLGLVGPAANGRDIAGAFGASSWIHIYFIMKTDGTIASIASLTAPVTGPVLPTGYTHWAYATALRWNASSNIIPGRVQGNHFWYDLADGGVNRVLTNGVATTITAVACSGFIPPNAVTGTLITAFVLVHTSFAFFEAYLRPTGASAAGEIYTSVNATTGNTTGARTYASIFMGTSQQIDYKLNAAPATSGGLSIDVVGFDMPNGG